MRKLMTVSLLSLFAGTAYAQTPAPFTASQVDAGRDAYLTNCVGCHQKTLQGSGEAPGLTGDTFIGAWGKRDTKALYTVIKASMPAGRPDSLGAETYTNIVAFLLAANGAKAGATPLTPATTVPVGSIASGKMPAEMAQAIANAKPAPARNRTAPPEKTGITVAGTVAQYTPVTNDMLTHPADADWLMHLRTYQGWSYSPLTQIDTSNVGNLQLKWVWAMQDEGRQQMNPLVHDGVMFLSNNRSNIVQALDAKTGTLIWENHIGPSLIVENATRTMALWQNLLIYPATDGKLYALDARTGKIVWQTQISTQGNKIGGIMVIHGRIVLGLTRCDARPTTEHCYVGALDAATGKPLWKFVTVALKGQPGGDSWNGQPDDMRSGGDVWISGTYDPVRNETYWGTGQAKPHLRSARGTGGGATDYTNSTVALDPDTGKLKWWHNLAPGESLDLDEVFERTVMDHDGRQELVTVGKTGIMWKEDRASGKYLDHAETVFQNIYTKIDPKTGIPTYRADIVNQKTGDQLASCPSAEGGHDWPSTSFDPRNDLILIPLSQSCFLFGGSSQRLYEMPGTDGNMGRLSAYHAADFKPAWSFQQRSPFLTGVISTAGGVSFVGDYDRVFRAVDTKTGETLWQTRLGTTVQGYPISFSVDGEQFIAVTTGTQGGSPEGKPQLMLKGDVNRPANGQAVYVFTLPHKH
jgi:alcohol dehydrogenase (cytochrome c)